MSTLNTLIPRQPVPALDVLLLGEGRFTLAVPPAPTFAVQAASRASQSAARSTATRPRCSG